MRRPAKPDVRLGIAPGVVPSGSALPALFLCSMLLQLQLANGLAHQFEAQHGLAASQLPFPAAVHGQPSLMQVDTKPGRHLQQAASPPPSPSPAASTVVSTYVAMTLQGVTVQQLNDTAALLSYRKIIAKYLIGTSWLGLKPAYERVNVTVISSDSASAQAGRRTLSRGLTATGASGTFISSSVSMLSSSVQSGTSSLADAYNGGGLLNDLNSGGITTSALCCLQVNDDVFPNPASASPPAEAAPSSPSSPDGGSKGVSVIMIGVICGVVAVVAVMAMFGARVIIRNRSKEREENKEQIVANVVARAAKRHNWTNARVAMMERLLGKKPSSHSKPTSSEYSAEKEPSPTHSDDLTAARDALDQAKLGPHAGGAPSSPASDSSRAVPAARSSGGESGDGALMSRAKVMPLRSPTDADVAAASLGADASTGSMARTRRLNFDGPQRLGATVDQDGHVLLGSEGGSWVGGSGLTPLRSIPKGLSVGADALRLSAAASEASFSPSEMDRMRPAFMHSNTTSFVGSPLPKRIGSHSMSGQALLEPIHNYGSPRLKALGQSNQVRATGAWADVSGGATPTGSTSHAEISDLELVNNCLKKGQQRLLASEIGGGTMSARNLSYDEVSQPAYLAHAPAGSRSPMLNQRPMGPSLDQQRSGDEEQRQDGPGPENAFDLKALAAHLKNQRLKAGGAPGSAGMTAGPPAPAAPTMPVSRPSKQFKPPPQDVTPRSTQPPAPSPFEKTSGSSNPPVAARPLAAAAAIPAPEAAAVAPANPNPPTPPSPPAGNWSLLNLMTLLRGRRHGPAPDGDGKATTLSQEDSRVASSMRTVHTASGIEIERVDSLEQRSRRSSLSDLRGGGNDDFRQAFQGSGDGSEGPRKSRSVAWTLHP